ARSAGRAGVPAARHGDARRPRPPRPRVGAPPLRGRRAARPRPGALSLVQRATRGGAVLPADGLDRRLGAVRDPRCRPPPRDDLAGMSLLASWPRREIQDRPMEDRDETYDPFEALDRAAGAGAVRDPYPTFATLRGECPVHHGRLSAAFGLPEAFEAVIAGMLGLPEADLPRFHRWAVELINIAGDIQRGLAASQTLRDYFAGVLAARRRDPQEDMISVLAHAELDGQRLTDEEIFAFLRLLLPAGAETTYRSSSNLFCGLLTHPDQLEAVRADRSLVRRAIDEGLRWEPPLTGIAR